MIDPNQPRGQWKIGHIIQTFPGEDGLVRVIKIQTKTGVYSRVIHRLCLLERASTISVLTAADPAIDKTVQIRAARCSHLQILYSNRHGLTHPTPMLKFRSWFGGECCGDNYCLRSGNTFPLFPFFLVKAIYSLRLQTSFSFTCHSLFWSPAEYLLLWSCYLSYISASGMFL